MAAAIRVEPSWGTTDSAGVRTAHGSTAGAAAPRHSGRQAVVVNDSVLVAPVAQQSEPSTVLDQEPDRRALLPSLEPSVVPMPQLRVGADRFDLRQQWEGTVQAIEGEDVVAVLRDLTDPSRPEEEVTIGLDEVSPDDRPLVSPGAIFYWSIGYRTSPFGQVERVSAIRFRRLPAWSKRDIRRIEERTRELIDFLGVSGEIKRAQGE
ncbi:MAG: hypothetical protein HYV09_26170 [Deltaproteobacteria bacterium]|nr:hypothetical protein [Deltaproteobacteria bacterium]